MSGAWSRTWNRLTSTNPDLALAVRAVMNGKLFAAVELAAKNSFSESIGGRRFLRRLVDALLERSANEQSAGSYSSAWKTISAAASVSLHSQRDQIAKQTSELVEMTIDVADANLVDGKPGHALRLVDEVVDRGIADWRADRIKEVAERLKAAERYSAAGDCDQCLVQLREAKNLRPDVPYLDTRISTCQLRKNQIDEFTKRLQNALLADELTEVERVCRQLLVIAPNYKTAQDAQRRVLEIRQKQTSAGVRNTVYAGSSNGSKQKPASSPPARKAASEGSHVNNRVVGDPHPSVNSEQSFMMWIDGVGGYLVCPALQNTIGQAISQSNIQIQILGDLQRRHCRIETVEQSHLLQPLGNLTVDGKKTSQPQQLRNDQIIELEGGVKLNYARPHPLSGSARIDFLSRHRTQPWADSVLLASGPIILGPDSRNHVYCPRWPWDLIIFQRDGNWFARTRGKLEIDGVIYQAEGPFQLNSRIIGEEFTMSLEPISTDTRQETGG